MKIYQAISVGNEETTFHSSEVAAKKAVTEYGRQYGKGGYVKTHEIGSGKSGLISFLNKYELHRRQSGN